MTFNEGGSFEGGRVRKGGRGKGPVIAGGGIAAVLVAVVVALLNGGDLGSVLGTVSEQVQPAGAEDTAQQQYVEECTVEQANTERECRLSATALSLDDYWSEALPDQVGVDYVVPDVVSFEAATATGCGSATSAVGPFYCPPDQTVYIDVSFFDELRDRFGSSGGPLAEEYVVAHEFGHHIEQLSGAMSSADRSGTGPESDSVRIELMADCLAGMWAGNAATNIDDKRGVPFMQEITPTDLKDALSAASAVGDDRIQQSATGSVNPEAWTHGSSEQRQRWFMTGYDGGTFQDCNALEASTL
ncbi:neutral zinc metallopeptidase [Oerskovia sp. Sa1BUA8]|uniref:Neutral zinc metallopeptidase n=1 Tax=Oerskovia douganii TaxID=2762210 RepID=A0A9D5UAK1_9CELL|nr:neutral zinc metallopeptidase [Oerskovia douganii]MBE7701355.1 neutral zinc metallopeptidase [Oerskovia douganii]